jgi:hypothetical protein
MQWSDGRFFPGGIPKGAKNRGARPTTIDQKSRGGSEPKTRPAGRPHHHVLQLVRGPEFSPLIVPIQKQQIATGRHVTVQMGGRVSLESTIHTGEILSGWTPVRIIGNDNVGEQHPFNSRRSVLGAADRD